MGARAITHLSASDATASASLNRRLFILSCIALAVTSMTFAIRAGMLMDWGQIFSLTPVQLGWIASMAFFGFPAATILGGLLYNYVGPKWIMIIAFWGHIAGFILTIASQGFNALLVSTFFVGFANGAIEAACNPMIVRLYPNEKVTRLNYFHIWFPGGIVIGSILAIGIKALGAQLGLTSTWQIEIAVMILPTLVYGWMLFKTKFPPMLVPEPGEANTLTNIKALFSPLFIFMCLLMTVTATVELGTQQWIGPLLKMYGANPLVVLILVSSIIAIGRIFAKPLLRQFNPFGVLMLSALLSAIGIYLLSIAMGNLTYVGAVIFAMGVCFFWPTMLGVVSVYLPNTGALGLSVIGGVGMVGLATWQPVIGRWLMEGEAQAAERGIVGDSIQLAAGQSTLGNIMLFPIALFVAFSALFFLRARIEARAASLKS